LSGSDAAKIAESFSLYGLCLQAGSVKIANFSAWPNIPQPKKRDSMEIEALKEVVLKALDDMKAKDVVELDVRGKTSITDIMIIASGTSDRHVKAIAQSVAFKAKQAGEPPLGTEGIDDGEWALVDLNGVVVHVMQPKVRDFYHLERLWSMDEPAAKPNVESH